MKKKALVITLYLLLSAALVSAIAAGGDSSDPLISLSFLNGAYTSTVDTKVSEKLAAADQSVLDSATVKLGSLGSVAGLECADVWTEQRLKEGDSLSGPAGLNVLVLAGGMQVSYSSGAVVDVTTGEAVKSGTALTPGHRYMAAEDTAAQFTVTTKTAVVDYMGYYLMTGSSAVDYNAMAAALKTMHLFRGSFTGYGEGFDLEVGPTRLQALIMFIRVLGEEDAALAYTGSTPFADIARGSDAEKYVGYAYEKGYTNGYTATAWKPAQSVNLYQYTEFVLRATGHSSTANTNLADTLERAVAAGVLTGGEVAAMKNETFLRAQLVYISYYGLDATLSGDSSTLRDLLISKGVFTAADAAAASALVTSQRIR